MKLVLVLMSTYNGVKFIREQIDSIISQEGIDVYLLIRDDGSNDDTCGILEEYASKYNNVEWFPGDNVGFVRSFSILVERAVCHKCQPDYFAFADQDDIWFPEKLYKSYAALRDLDVSKPNLFTCNSMRIDKNRREMGLFHEGLKPVIRRGNVLIYGTEQGCSMTFNLKAAEIFANNQPKVSTHDRWLYLICFYLGNVIYDHSPLFYYRIHGNNTLAKMHDGTKRKSTIGRIKNLFMFHFFDNPITNHIQMAKEFYDIFGDLIKVEDRIVINYYLTYRNNILSKCHIMFDNDYQCPYKNTYEELPHHRYTFFNLL